MIKEIKMNKKYMMFGWVIDGSGWLIKDTLDEAKNEWCFGRMIFEIDEDKVEELNKYGQKVKSHRLIIEKLKENYPLVYQEGEPPEYFVVK